MRLISKFQVIRDEAVLPGGKGGGGGGGGGGGNENR